MQLSFDPRTDVRQAFATPIGRLEVPNASEINPRIAEVVLAREKADQGVNRSNRGGWHSDNDFLSWPELQFTDLEDTFRSAIVHMIAFTTGTSKFDIKLTLEAWANVNRAGSFNSNHIHPHNHWSGVYYVQTAGIFEDPVPKAGKIHFNDPRGPITMFRSPGQHDSLTIDPEEGVIVIFPSWLFHSVNPFTVETTRISIAFNGRIDGFRPING